MCGHGTIGVATVLVETGMVPVTQPVTTVRLDTPAGLVVAEVAVREDGAATGVTIRNVPSFPVALDATVDVPGFGEVRYDLAFGGNFYAIVELDDAGPAVRPRGRGHACSTPGLSIMEAINAADRPGAPGATRASPAATTSTSRPRVRTPGTPGTRWPSTRAGSTARRAAPAPRPAWPSCRRAVSSPLGQDFVNESFIGTRFVGRLVEETTVGGLPAVVPTVTGRAWITGTAQYLLDPEDPFPAGFLL